MTEPFVVDVHGHEPSRAPEPVLDFVIAGVQKAGTTTLDTLLRQHPDIGMAKVKETHYFDDETRDWVKPDYEQLHSLLPTGDRLTGEATPITFYWTPALYRVREYRPQMRLIVIFRDPIDRAISQYRMQTAGPWLQGAPLPERLSLSDSVGIIGRQRVLRGREVPGLERVTSYVERGLYGVQLRHALTVFPREQLLLLDFEDLRRDQAQVLRLICDFLDLPFSPLAKLADRHEHRTLAPPQVLSAQDEHMLREVYRADLQVFADLSGLDVSRWRTANDRA